MSPLALLACCAARPATAQTLVGDPAASLAFTAGGDLSTRVAGGEGLAPALMATGFLSSRHLGRVATAEKAGDLGPELRLIATEEFAAADLALEAAVGGFTKGLYVLMALAILVYGVSIIGSLPR